MTTTASTGQTLDRDRTAASALDHATPEGTRRFAARFQDRFAADFYRELDSRILASSIGIGTYLGECSDEEDARYVSLIAEGLSRGINLVDTGINYRCQRSERAVGRAIRQALNSDSIARDEVVICTKGGFVPLESQPPGSRDEYRAYLGREYFDRNVISPSDLVGGHCLKPRFIADQIERSRTNLGVARIDVFYVHNPEQQLESVGRAEFLDMMRDVFIELESQVQLGTIGMYGCATWHGFRLFAANRSHLSLTELLRVAREAGGPDHHFRAVQLPVNLAMTEGVRAPTQQHEGKNLSILALAHQMGIAVIASASLMQSQLTNGLPPEAGSAFPWLETDAQRAIAFVRALGVTSALVGMKTIAHLDENLVAGHPVQATARSPKAPVS
ncbi:MAG: aldo/keto reductase [Gemmatimonadaceae bacterium]